MPMNMFYKKIQSIAGRLIGRRPAEYFPIDAWTDDSYNKWFMDHSASAETLKAQRQRVFQINPTYSFVVPLYQTPKEYLSDMAESLFAQTYENFELILVNASPENLELAKEVRNLIESDGRVKLVNLSDNYGITENTNKGIEIATGDFLCFLDHDDYLEPNLLYEYTEAINIDPKIDVLYCDEDMVEGTREKRHHLHPLFKPDFSPELLLCKNYIIHLMTIRRSIISAMPKPAAHMDGSQDYNMILFATEQARKVKHVPKVLYHWRISDNSTATNPDSKPYTSRSNKLAIQKHLQRTEQSASIISSGIANLHNLWFNLQEKPLVSVVVSHTGTNMQLQTFLEAFQQVNTYENIELLVATPSECTEPFDTSLPIRLITSEIDEMTKFHRFNKGANNASGDFLLFLESDLAFITAEPLEQLIGLGLRQGIGAVAPKTLYSGNEVKSFGIAITSERIVLLYHGYPDDFPAYQCNTRAFQNVSAIESFGMLTPRNVFDTLGGFNVSYESELGTVDYCQRLLQHSYRLVQTPTVKIQTSDRCPTDRYGANNSDFSSDDLSLFNALWSNTKTSTDPYYNQNLNQRAGYYQVQL